MPESILRWMNLFGRCRYQISEHEPLRGALSIMDPREFAIEVVNQLQSSGHQALWAGGCVRDQLLGRTPKDYDVATSALPGQVREVFGKKRTLPIGASFGVITVLGPRESVPVVDSGGNPTGETETVQHAIEVATFRRDGGYSDGRRPDSIEYTDAEEDAKRRDFTINGMFFDPVNEQVLDFVDGREDLRAKQIRAIGNPHKRIEEDKLRMLRGVRFASTFEFALEPQTLAAIQKHAPEIALVSGERIGAEVRRMLAHIKRRDSVALLRESGLLNEIVPGGDEVFGGDQEWNTMLESLGRLGGIQPDGGDFESAAAILLEPVIEQHGIASIYNAWKLSNDQKQSIGWICKHWRTLDRADEEKWSVIQPLLLRPDAGRALAVAEAKCGSVSDGVALCRERLAWPADRLNPEPFLDGRDLIGMGVEKGPKFKQILNAIRDAQLDGKILSVEQAEEFAKSFG